MIEGLSLGLISAPVRSEITASALNSMDLNHADIYLDPSTCPTPRLIKDKSADFSESLEVGVVLPSGVGPKADIQDVPDIDSEGTYASCTAARPDDLAFLDCLLWPTLHRIGSLTSTSLPQGSPCSRPHHPRPQTDQAQLPA